MNGYNVAIADSSLVGDIQKLQDSVMASFTEAQRGLIYPRSAEFRNFILECGGDLYVVRDDKDNIVASLISAPLNDHDDYKNNLCVELLAGGNYLVPNTRRRVLTTALVHPDHKGKRIWGQMVRHAIADAVVKGSPEVSLGVFLDNNSVIERASGLGCYVTALVGHRAMKKKGFLFSVNGEAQNFSLKDVREFSYEDDFDLSVNIESYLDNNYVGISFDQQKKTMLMAECRHVPQEMLNNIAA